MNSINENKLLFFDVETCGSYSSVEEMEEKNIILYNLWSKIGESYFKRHYPEDERMSNGELYKKYAGLLPEFGRVVCVSAGLGFSLCGHNIKNFDLPYLGKRMFINKVKPSDIMPSHDTKPWEIKALDTKELWNFGSYKGLSSLHLICGVLGLDTPKDGKVDGSNIHKSYYSDNNIGEIKEYCEKDVHAIMDIINHIQSL